jgi:hypothetical protein
MKRATEDGHIHAFFANLGQGRSAFHDLRPNLCPGMPALVGYYLAAMFVSF